MLVGFALFVWVVFCASLTLIIGSGAERYAFAREEDLNETMFYAGIACFLFGGVMGWIFRLAGFGKERRQESDKPGWGLGFMVGTALLALVAGIAIDIAN
ncbi:MAG: hypothetical protein M3320_10450 [Actinomycetota bacterium]|nr:hypothetical protein [Actinomycetota bacterium]MDQ5809084.1 hypothetical protein [Actinomycetota bacterium]